MKLIAGLDISHTAIKHAITSGWITGIDLDMDSKPEICKPCAKAKSAHQPFLKKSDTQATEYGECVHWGLWGLTSVRSLNGNLYCAAHRDDHFCKISLYLPILIYLCVNISWCSGSGGNSMNTSSGLYNPFQQSVGGLQTSSMPSES